MKILTCAATLLTALGLLSCGSSSSTLNTKEAVRKAIVDHLGSRKGLDLDMSAMDVEVGDMSFKPDEAEATVSFRPKGSPEASGMKMKYSFVREGNAWKVKPKPAAAPGANPHGMGMPPTEGAPAVMPPGHPPVEGKK